MSDHISAFGVDHGYNEVEKAFNPMGLFRAAGGAHRAAGSANMAMRGATAGKRVAQTQNAFSRVGSAIGGGLQRGGQRLQTGAMGRYRAGVREARKMTPGPGRNAAMAGMRAGTTGQIKTAGAMQRVGGAMMRRPGLTGGLAVGGAAGGGAMALHTPDRKKLQQFR